MDNMDNNNNNYIENYLRRLSANKSGLCLLCFGVLSVLLALIYITEMRLGVTQLLFMLSVIISGAINAVFALDTEGRIRRGSDLVLGGIALVLLGGILRLIQCGVLFSIQAFLAFLVACAALTLTGVLLCKNDAPDIIPIVLLAVLAAYDIFMFFYQRTILTSAFMWKIYRFAQAALYVDYIALLLYRRKKPEVFIKRLGGYRLQVPSRKICLGILAIIALVSVGIGTIQTMNKRMTARATVQHQETKATATPGSQSTAAAGTVSRADNQAASATPRENAAAGTVSRADGSTASAKPQTASTEVTDLPLGQTVTTNDIEFTLNGVELSYDVKPNNPPSFYTHYAADAGQVYIYVNATVKNLRQQPLDCDEIYSVTADYDNGYTYQGFNIVTKTDGNFGYANITSVDPLQTLGVHCLIDCPEEVESSGKPLSLTIKLKSGEQYRYVVR